MHTDCSSLPNAPLQFSRFSSQTGNVVLQFTNVPVSPPCHLMVRLSNGPVARSVCFLFEVGTQELQLYRPCFDEPLMHKEHLSVLSNAQGFVGNTCESPHFAGGATGGSDLVHIASRSYNCTPSLTNSSTHGQQQTEGGEEEQSQACTPYTPVVNSLVAYTSTGGDHPMSQQVVTVQDVSFCSFRLDTEASHCSEHRSSSEWWEAEAAATAATAAQVWAFGQGVEKIQYVFQLHVNSQSQRESQPQRQSLSRGSLSAEAVSQPQRSLSRRGCSSLTVLLIYTSLPVTCARITRRKRHGQIHRRASMHVSHITMNSVTHASGSRSGRR